MREPVATETSREYALNVITTTIALRVFLLVFFSFFIVEILVRSNTSKKIVEILVRSYTSKKIVDSYIIFYTRGRKVNERKIIRERREEGKYKKKKK